MAVPFKGSWDSNTAILKGPGTLRSTFHRVPTSSLFSNVCGYYILMLCTISTVLVFVKGIEDTACQTDTVKCISTKNKGCRMYVSQDFMCPGTPSFQFKCVPV